MPGMKRPTEKQYSFTYRKDSYDERDYLYEPRAPYESIAETRFLTPDSIDWSNSMSPVKDQMRLGSCVGFAVSALKEWQEQKEHRTEVESGKFDHRSEKYYDLSEAWIYWMSKKIDPWPGIEGTSIRCAMKVLHRIGAPTEKAWPYDDVVKGSPEKWAHLVARWALIDSYWRVTSLEELKDALKDGPVVLGIGVYEEMLFVGDDGIVEDPKYPQFSFGGHAVCAVGYDDNKKLVKFKNSWSDKWGQKGYGYVSYYYVRNFAWDAWTCRDMNVTREMLAGARSLL